MSKLTFEEAIERLNDQRRIARGDVKESALRRTVWEASAYMPGYLCDNMPFICATKKQAVAASLELAAAGDTVPRGMTTALNAPGDEVWFDYGSYRYKVQRMTLADLIL